MPGETLSRPLRRMQAGSLRDKDEPAPCSAGSQPASLNLIAFPSPNRNQTDAAGGDARATRGFTLVELLVVLAIIATLLSLATPRYFQHVERSREVVLKENLATLRDAIDQYHADKGIWPPHLASLAEQRYIRQVPIDPVTGRADTWQEIPAPGAGESGIQDVRSGAEGKSLEGGDYAEW